MSVINIEVEKALKDVRSLVRELGLLRSAIASISGVSAKSFELLTDRVDKLEKELRQTNSAMKVLTVTTRRQNDAMKKQIKEVDKSTKAFKKQNTTWKKTLSNLKRMAGALGFAGVALAIANTVKSVVTLTIKFQSLGFALAKISNNASENIRSMQFLMELNDKFGATLSTTTERWLKFRAASRQSNISLVETMNIFRSVTKASAVLGLRTDELRGIYLALEQMLSKGKVTTEELRRQLGERLPGAMGIMADALGVSISQLDKMMKKGEILSAVALPKFAIALEKAYGIESLESVENLATAVGKMSGAWDRFVLTVSEGDSFLTAAIGGTMTLITKAMNALTNFLETYEQTSRRLSKELFGDIVNKSISDRIELRLKEAGVLKETEAEIKTRINLLEKEAEVTDAESDERIEAVKKVMDAESDLLELQKLKSTEGHLMAVAAIEDIRKNVKSVEDLIDANQKTIDQAPQETVVRATADGVETFEDFSDEQRQNIKLAQEENEVLKARHILLLEEKLQFEELIKLKGGTGGLIPDEGAIKRRIKFAKEYAESNKLAISLERESIETNKFLLEQESLSFGERQKLQEENHQSKLYINELEREEDINAINVKYRNEVKKWVGVLSAFTVGSDKYIAQLAEKNKAIENLDDKHKDDLLIAEQKFQENKNSINIGNKGEVDKIIRQDFSTDSASLKATFDNLFGLQDEQIRNTAKGSAAHKAALEERMELEVKFANAKIDLQIAMLKKLQANASEADQGTFDKLIEGAEALKTEFKTLEEELYTGEGAWENWAKKAMEVMDSVSELVDAVFDKRIAQIDEEIEKETEKYDRLLELAKNDEAETKIIERNKALRLKELEEKKRKEQIKQAKFEKAMALNQAVINTALAVSAALTAGPGVGLALAVITAAIAAIEVATIAATPIPTFAKGGVMGADGLAVVNDGGNMEYIERNGEILTSSRKDAIVNLEKGDIIHRDYDTLIRKSMLMNGVFNGGSASGDDYMWMENAIEKGFKKARNTVNVSVLNSTNSYKSQMQNWN